MPTSTQTQLRRGTSSQVAAMTPALGEVVVNTTDKQLHLGDGTTAGGVPMAKLASPAFTGNPTAPTASPGDSDTTIATTAFVAAAIAAIPPVSGLPAAVTGTLTTGSTAAFTVDFTTYSAYDVILEGVTASPGGASVSLNVSSNGGTSYATESRGNVYVNSGGTVGGNNGFDLSLNNGSTSGLIGTLTQGSTGGGALFTYTGGYPTLVSQSGHTRYATSAAINQVRLSCSGGTFSTGNVILQPKSKR